MDITGITDLVEVLQLQGESKLSGTLVLQNGLSIDLSKKINKFHLLTDLKGPLTIDLRLYQEELKELGVSNYHLNNLAHGDFMFDEHGDMSEEKKRQPRDILLDYLQSLLKKESLYHGRCLSLVYADRFGPYPRLPLGVPEIPAPPLRPYDLEIWKRHDGTTRQYRQLYWWNTNDNKFEQQLTDNKIAQPPFPVIAGETLPEQLPREHIPNITVYLDFSTKVRYTQSFNSEDLEAGIHYEPDQTGQEYFYLSLYTDVDTQTNKKLSRRKLPTVLSTMVSEYLEDATPICTHLSQQVLEYLLSQKIKKTGEYTPFTLQHGESNEYRFDINLDWNTSSSQTSYYINSCDGPIFDIVLTQDIDVVLVLYQHQLLLVGERRYREYSYPSPVVTRLLELPTVTVLVPINGHYTNYLTGPDDQGGVQYRDGKWTSFPRWPVDATKHPKPEKEIRL